MNPDQVLGAWAMVNYIYNTSGEQFVKDVFPHAVGPYVREKAEAWSRSPTRAIGYLDREHRERLFQAVARELGAARATL